MRLGNLIKHILINGKFYYSGPDFEERRIRMVADLGEFCPPGSFKTSRKARLMRNRYLRAWISEAAYAANSFSTHRRPFGPGGTFSMVYPDSPSSEHCNVQIYLNEKIS